VVTPAFQAYTSICKETLQLSL